MPELLLAIGAAAEATPLASDRDMVTGVSVTEAIRQARDRQRVGTGAASRLQQDLHRQAQSRSFVIQR